MGYHRHMAAEETPQIAGATIIPFPTSDAHEPASEDRSPLSVREALGDVLRDERLSQKRTLADVADGAGVSLPYLSEVERGIKDVSSEVFESISRSLYLEPADALERTARRLRTRASGGPMMSLLAA